MKTKNFNYAKTVKKLNLNQACQMIAEYYLEHHKGKKLPKNVVTVMSDSRRIAA